ncbi:MAG: hypothetical protein GXX83_07215 [Gaiellales bacterium]|nr:hypothetical protein [Gaiellales bacterium]
MDERLTGVYGLSEGIALAGDLAAAGRYIFSTDDVVELVDGYVTAIGPERSNEMRH